MNQTPPQLPPQLASMMQAMAAAGSATNETRALGGDPPVLDALAQLQSQVVEGIRLWANPCATYAGLRLIRKFYPEPEGNETDLEIDQLAGMVWCFAEPVAAYLSARRGQEDFLVSSMHWLGDNFKGAEAEFRLGRAVGWCLGVLKTLDALNPRKPMPPTTQPGAVPVAASALHPSQAPTPA